jgi:hypothetical protein
LDFDSYYGFVPRVSHRYRPQTKRKIESTNLPECLETVECPTTCMCSTLIALTKRASDDCPSRFDIRNGERSQRLRGFPHPLRDFFLGTWLKHMQLSPFYMRLFRPERMRYERIVHPISIPNGTTRHQSQGRHHLQLERAFFQKDFHERRINQKEIFFRIPARPVFKFVMTYFGKRGFLDGQAGLSNSLLQAFYEYMIVLKTREIEEGEKDRG